MRKLLFAYLIILTSTSWAVPRVSADDGIGNLSIQFYKVEFKSGRPLSGDSIESSVVDFKLTEKNLSIIVDSLKKIDKVEAEVIGFTDTKECSSLECKYLSLRRAKMVYSWLIRHGVPMSRLRGPTGGGNEWPIGDNKTKVGREANRRVQFDLFLVNEPG